jgi:hypothetical protein
MKNEEKLHNEDPYFHVYVMSINRVKTENLIY